MTKTNKQMLIFGFLFAAIVGLLAFVAWPHEKHELYSQRMLIQAPIEKVEEKNSRQRKGLGAVESQPSLWREGFRGFQARNEADLRC
jgi:hypothetical protein